jgi:flagellar basal-body rod protein FlgF
VSDGIWSALSGAVGQMAVLDTAANNVANASTPGFRADRPMFKEILSRASTGRGANGAAQRGQWQNVRYAAVDAVTPDMTPGAISQTGRPLDVALRGEGMFTVQTPQGERYTRVGNVRIATDGTLTTNQGHPYLGVDKRPIKVSPTSTDAAIAPDGSVKAGGAIVGTLQVVSFQKPSELQKAEPLLFQATPASGAAKPIAAVLEPGSIEGSNVSAVKGMVDLIGATRGFEACQSVIQAFKDADRRAAMALMGTG